MEITRFRARTSDRPFSSFVNRMAIFMLLVRTIANNIMDIRIEYKCIYHIKEKNKIWEKYKSVFDWILGSTKKRPSSKKGKRPLSSSHIPAPKYPRLLKDEGMVCFCSSSNKG